MKTIDTRDLLKRKNELEELRDAVTEAQETLAEAKAELDAHRAIARGDSEEEEWDERDEELEEAVTDAETALESAQADFGPDEQTELNELETLENEISDFRHGEQMIPEGDFEDYAREMVEDLGSIPGDLPAFIRNNIDWSGVAKDLSADYTIVTYQGEDYYVLA